MSHVCHATGTESDVAVNKAAIYCRRSQTALEDQDVLAVEDKEVLLECKEQHVFFGKCLNIQQSWYRGNWYSTIICNRCDFVIIVVCV